MTADLGFIHRFIPAPGGAEAPTLLLLHGTGGNETDLLELGQALAPGAALLSPRGKVLEQGRPRFFRRLTEGVFDLEDLRLRSDELAGFIEAAASAYAFAPDRVIAVGYSNGANIAASLLLLHPGLLRAAVLFHPMVPLVPDTLPDISATPIFIGAGRFDTLVPRVETEQLAALFRQAGADVTVYWQADGHTLTLEEVRAAEGWLRRNQLAGGRLGEFSSQS